MVLADAKKGARPLCAERAPCRGIGIYILLIGTFLESVAEAGVGGLAAVVQVPEADGFAGTPSRAFGAVGGGPLHDAVLLVFRHDFEEFHEDRKSVV